MVNLQLENMCVVAKVAKAFVSATITPILVAKNKLIIYYY